LGDPRSTKITRFRGIVVCGINPVVVRPVTRRRLRRLQRNPSQHYRQRGEAAKAPLSPDRHRVRECPMVQVRLKQLAQLLSGLIDL
jgi:hypothetical protein